MKNLFLSFSLLIAFNALASMQFSESKGKAPTTEELNKNHACFQELSTNGCGDPADDPRHFRSCMADVYQHLSKDCRKLMSDLYSSR